ncbi:hypothetical protein, partial [Pseudomonas aeruginosa]
QAPPPGSVRVFSDSKLTSAMVLCFGLLNALGITAFGRAEVILTFGMWSTLMIFAVTGLLRLPAVELQG